MNDGDFDLGGGWAARCESNGELSIFHNRGGVRLSVEKAGELGAWYAERLAALDVPAEPRVDGARADDPDAPIGGAVSGQVPDPDAEAG